MLRSTCNQNMAACYIIYIHCYCVQMTKLIWKMFWSPPNPIIVSGTKLLPNTNIKPQPVCRIWIAPIWVTCDPHFKVTTLFDIKYLKDNTRQNHNHYRTSIVSHMHKMTVIVTIERQHKVTCAQSHGDIVYGFVLVFYSNFVPKTHRFWDIRLISIPWPWNPCLGSLKVIGNVAMW